MMKFASILILAAVSLAAAAFAAATLRTGGRGGEPEQDKVKVVTQKDDNGSVAVKVNTQLEVFLPSQLGAGELWSIKAPEPKHIRLQKGYPKYEDEPGIPGAEQSTVFLFDAIDPGVDQLDLERGRPDLPPTKTFTIRVEVTK
jgi:predicted secreted protein